MSRSPLVRVKLNQPLLPALVVALGLLQFLAPYRGWTILLVGFGALWLVGFLWARSLARGLRLTRELRLGWAQVGDIVEERFTLSKTGWLPAVWVEVLDQSKMPGYQASMGTGVSGNGENQWSMQQVCTRRGVYTLGPTTLRTGDPFGIYTVVVEYPALTTLTVLPPVVSLPAFDFAQGGRRQERRRAPRAFERTIGIKGLREYTRGDHWRDIDWRSLARRDTLSVRLFEHSSGGDWWIFLDLAGAVQVGADDHSTLEYGIILAASLASRGLQAGHAVGLVAHGEKLVRLAPRAGEDQRLEILYALALATTGAVPLADLLAHACPAEGQPAGLIIITPSPESGWMDALSLPMAQGSLPTVFLLDRRSFGSARVQDHKFADLVARGIPCHLITREMLCTNTARPVNLRWKVLDERAA